MRDAEGYIMVVCMVHMNKIESINMSGSIRTDGWRIGHGEKTPDSEKYENALQ